MNIIFKYAILSVVFVFFVKASKSKNMIYFSNQQPIQSTAQAENDSEVHLKDFVRNNLDDAKIYPWFKTGYDAYKPDGFSMNLLTMRKDHISIIIFGGSWCDDTKNLLPEFYKVAENAGISPDQITLIGVDRNKDSRDGRSKQYNIEKVPTFILMYDGKEIGRIVESVQKNIETDITDAYSKAGH